MTNNVDLDLSNDGLQLNVLINGTNKICNIQHNDLTSSVLSLENIRLTASMEDLRKLDVTPGIASSNKALVVDNSLNINNINTLSLNKLLLNNIPYLTSNDNNSSYLTNITPGIASPLKVVIPNSNLDIMNLNKINSSKYILNNTNIINEPLLSNYQIKQNLHNGILYKKYPSNVNIYSIAWSNTLSLFVAVGDCWGM